MIKLDYRIEGRSVRPEDFAKEFVRTAVDEVHHQVIERIRRVHCPIHGTLPKNVRVKRLGGNRVSYEFEACCSELETAAAKTFD